LLLVYCLDLLIYWFSYCARWLFSYKDKDPSSTELDCFCWFGWSACWLAIFPLSN